VAQVTFNFRDGNGALLAALADDGGGAGLAPYRTLWVGNGLVSTTNRLPTQGPARSWTSLSAPATPLTAELNALANAARAVSAAIAANTATKALFELRVQFGSAPVADSLISLFAIPSLDGGTTYADGDVGVGVASNLRIGQFRSRAVNTVQVLMLTNIDLPPGHFRLVLQNDAGQAFAATGNTLRMATYNQN